MLRPNWVRKMSRVLLLPRLSAFGVSSILDAAGQSPMTPAANRALLEEHASMLSFAASGGSRSEELANSIGAAIRRLAADAGFPENSSQVARAKFDHNVAIYLGAHPGLTTGEAQRDDVWAYLATVVVPDVVSWRFPDPAPHRFEGGVRNALQRLWMRGSVLDRGADNADRWALIRNLSEDAAVQIFERASIGGNPTLARAIAEVWVRTAAAEGRGAMESAMRRATKLVRLRNEVIDLSSLPGAELEAQVLDIFRQALQAPEKA